MVLVLDVDDVDQIFDALLWLTAQSERRPRRQRYDRRRRRRRLCFALSVMEPSNTHPVQSHLSLNARTMVAKHLRFSYFSVDHEETNSALLRRKPDIVLRALKPRHLAGRDHQVLGGGFLQVHL